MPHASPGEKLWSPAWITSSRLKPRVAFRPPGAAQGNSLRGSGEGKRAGESVRDGLAVAFRQRPELAQDQGVVEREELGSNPARDVETGLAPVAYRDSLGQVLRAEVIIARIDWAWCG